MSALAQMEPKEEPIHLDVKDLTFGYAGREPVLKNLNMQLSGGARCLLIGANGAGKSTILRILSGRHLTAGNGNNVQVLGRNAFHDCTLNFDRSYLDTDWGLRTVAFAGYGCPLQADIPVDQMMVKLQNEYPERREELLKLLAIDPKWRMHQVSDGQRRRVQIFLGLLRPFKILLLDEVTVSLDVVVRVDLLKYLEKESNERNCTIIYATHIFDGLDSWPTHVHYLTNKGDTGWQGELKDLTLYQEFRARGDPSPILHVAEHWLRAELKASNNAVEEPSGEQYQIEKNEQLKCGADRGSGFSAGRMAAYISSEK